MKNLLAAASLLALALAAPTPALSQEPTPEVSDETIRVDVNLVSLRFVVRDATGGFVNDLGPEAFRILQDGVPQDVVFFEPPHNRDGRGGRLWLAFLLDVSGSTFATRAEEIVAAQKFLDNVTDATQTGIFGFTDQLIPFQDFTSDRQLALKAFREARRHLGRTAIYDSLTSLMTVLKGKAPSGDRKAVIVISDGLDEAYRKSAAVISRARSEATKIYTILVPSAAQVYIGPSAVGGENAFAVNRPDEQKEAKEAAFARLSRQTGGKHFSGFEAILDFDDTLAQINDDLFGNLYTLGYYPDRDTEWTPPPNIDVQVSRPGLQVSLPFTKAPRSVEAKRSVVAAFFDREASLAASEDVSVRFEEIGAQIDVLAPKREGGLMGLPFRIKISPGSWINSQRVGVNTQLGVIGALVDPQGKETVRLREIFRVDMSGKEVQEGRGILYTNKLLAPPGSYLLKVALLELATWRLTTFERPVRIVEP